MLDSAITLFRERGVAATSMRDVVEHSGAPRGSIYHHFPGGKDQLAGEATAQAGAFIASLLVALDSEGLDAFFDYWARALERADFHDGCPVAAAALTDESPAARQEAGRAFERWQELLAAAFVRRGTAPDRATALATLVVASVEGGLVMARAQRSSEPLRRVELLLRELV